MVVTKANAEVQGMQGSHRKVLLWSHSAAKYSWQTVLMSAENQADLVKQGFRLGCFYRVPCCGYFSL